MLLHTRLRKERREEEKGVQGWGFFLSACECSRLCSHVCEGVCSLCAVHTDPSVRGPEKMSSSRWLWGLKITRGNNASREARSDWLYAVAQGRQQLHSRAQTPRHWFAMSHRRAPCAGMGWIFHKVRAKHCRKVPCSCIKYKIYRSWQNLSRLWTLWEHFIRFTHYILYSIVVFVIKIGK